MAQSLPGWRPMYLPAFWRSAPDPAESSTPTATARQTLNHPVCPDNAITPYKHGTHNVSTGRSTCSLPGPSSGRRTKEKALPVEYLSEASGQPTEAADGRAHKLPASACFSVPKKPVPSETRRLESCSWSCF